MTPDERARAVAAISMALAPVVAATLQANTQPLAERVAHVERALVDQVAEIAEMITILQGEISALGHRVAALEGRAPAMRTWAAAIDTRIPRC